MKLFRIFNTFVVSAFAVVAFSSCSGKETDYALDVAENLIWTRPDSSLSVLGSVDTLRLRPESSRARFSLLYAMALDRNCSTRLTSVSSVWRSDIMIATALTPIG